MPPERTANASPGQRTTALALARPLFCYKCKFEQFKKIMI